MKTLMKPGKKYSMSEPVTDLRHIKIVDNGEPLVNYLLQCPRLLMSKPRWSYHRVSLLRKGVADRLCRAAEALPDGYRLAVVEGWRPSYIQHRMYISGWQRWKERHPDWSDAQLRRVVNRFIAPLHGRVPPPHSTGAALDVLLADADGNELDHTSPFQPYDPKAYPTATKGLSDEARRHRDILSEALATSGLTNYPSEWWHWSYGDQGWAYRTGDPSAVYDRIEPADWSGHPDDMNEDLLVFADGLKSR